MYKVIITDVVCYPCGTYGNETRIAFHRSPKVAWERARRGGIHCHYHSDSPHGYGGTPVLQRRQFLRGTAVISDVWD